MKALIADLRLETLDMAILGDGSVPLEISGISGYFDFCGSVNWVSNT